MSAQAMNLPYRAMPPSQLLPILQPQSSANYQLPSSTSGQGFYDKYRNEQIAAWSLRQIHANLPVIDDPWVNQVLIQMTGQMNSVVRTVPLYHTVLLNDTNINAFAVPGGLIGINAGVILSAQSIDEVASVLAHEIAHISQRHYEHRLDNRKQLLAWQLGGLLAALAAASSGDSDAALAAMASSQAASAETAANHSREHEREADRVGMQILAQVGYDAEAMPRFFAKMQRQLSLNQAKNAFVPSFVQSHPFTAERLSEATTRAKSYRRPSQKTLHEQAVLFDRLYWRVKYLSKQTSKTELMANAKQSQGASLALVMYLADNGAFDEAFNQLDLVSLDKHEPVMCLTKSHILAAAKRHADRVAVLQNCQPIYPERRDLRLALADALVADSQPTQALLMLTPLIKDGSLDILAWQTAYRAYEQLAGQAQDDTAQKLAEIHALRSRSQIELWHGEYTKALQSLAQAEQIAQTNPKAATLSALLKKDKEQINTAKDFKP
ncbi:M48 family metalloprotease [Moraxella marmotae]|uniref:M48 family metalloprotease n=1 Tax=Moraxella marmotae TaxID=3344520 RepID=UPI0035F23BAD